MGGKSLVNALWFADCNALLERKTTMSNRSHVVSLAVAIVLAGSVWAQPQAPPGASGQPPPTGSTSGVPRNTPGDPGVAPQDKPRDPYTMHKDFARNGTQTSASEAKFGTSA